MRKISILLILTLLLLGCNSEKKIEKIKQRVLAEYSKAYPDDEFYMAYGPDYNRDHSQTNIRYRMILSSNRLEKLDYYNGFQVNLENVNSPIDTRNYQSKLDYLDVYAPLKREAKLAFGENMIFEIDGTYTSAMHKNFLERRGENYPRDKKTGLGMIIFTTFVDDLEKEQENVEYWKEKMYQLGKRYWEYYNATGALQLYIYDRELLENYELVKNSLLINGLKDKGIVDILKKIKNSQSISKEEEKKLLAKMINGKRFLDYKLIEVYYFTKSMKNKKELIKSNVKEFNNFNKF